MKYNKHILNDEADANCEVAFPLPSTCGTLDFPQLTRFSRIKEKIFCDSNFGPEPLTLEL